MRPNPPRLVTVVIAPALIVVGVSVTGAWAFVAAAVVLFVGMIFEGI